MLNKLIIQNYAIIDDLEIIFQSGLNIVTGETGAGKSIIMGALGLILGDRAETSVLVNKEKKCIVEGYFDVHFKKGIKDFLKENDLDQEDELVLRREVSANGKSRAFINDTPVTLDILRQLNLLLVDLHQQFDSLQLGENDFQRQVIDALAGQFEKVSEYKEVFDQWNMLKQELLELQSEKLQFEKEADYNQFQFDELDEASFRENELEEIESELKTLNNAEEIQQVLMKVISDLKESESPVINQLKILINQLQPFSTFHPQLPDLIQRLQTTHVEIQDIAGDLDSIQSQVYFDPDKIEELNDRLSLGYKLLKKHGVKTTNELLDIKMQFEVKLRAVLDIDEAIQKKEKEVNESHSILKSLAGKISDARRKQVTPFERKINGLLEQVGMPNARLKVEITDADELNGYGKDKIEILFDANKNNQFMPVGKVASGGELSRLMLCIKSQVVQKLDLPTMIFDEIDTGISGEAARQVGIIMKDLSAARQVVCITHQPQIAGKANAHYFVYKEIVGNAVKTNIRLLNAEERITAIAKMLSGEKPTAAAMDNAREMINN